MDGSREGSIYILLYRDSWTRAMVPLHSHKFDLSTFTRFVSALKPDAANSLIFVFTVLFDSLDQPFKRCGTTLSV